eukprot:scaffold1912_cov135-Cylindrotheca_fusiformis.AAC.22
MAKATSVEKETSGQQRQEKRRAEGLVAVQRTGRQWQRSKEPSVHRPRSFKSNYPVLLSSVAAMGANAVDM